MLSLLPDHLQRRFPGDLVAVLFQLHSRLTGFSSHSYRTRALSAAAASTEFCLHCRDVHSSGPLPSSFPASAASRHVHVPRSTPQLSRAHTDLDGLGPCFLMYRLRLWHSGLAVLLYFPESPCLSGAGSLRLFSSRTRRAGARAQALVQKASTSSSYSV
ncbi:hypothetical protein EXIGLDRAFT_353880 [Exidia glandulosa HHB12029]|uniref:Uncharacterized protein n=1 Tax=Exidia glandulosa HHB12029 TaxID=1314781 RepID=A0A165LD24_EXIGL|nr:hypothetical protein EXIGLDRAFT_353880 [Exidia glandulosa HHB12029]